MRMGRALIGLGLALAIAASASAWVFATQHRDALPPGHFIPQRDLVWPVAQGAASIRASALARAQVRLEPAAAVDATVLRGRAADSLSSPLACRFVLREPTGTTSKFDCVLEGGSVIKVKYGRNPEIHAEVAASRLLSALGYPADRVDIVPLVRCYGCPRYPFLTMRVLNMAGLLSAFPEFGRDGGYTEFDWVAVEHKFPAAAIEVGVQKGWAWWELERVDTTRGASAADLDALRLLAVFLAHWDNKAENQRLVCLDAPADPDRPCSRPLAMIQDLGATFGPTKANLSQWSALPVWKDPRRCTVTMEHLPWQGATFPDATISEEGRVQLAQTLARLTDEDLAALFAGARFPEFYSATADDKDLRAWTNAFRSRVDQIVSAGPCPQT
jgi:hypothetical protein